jgi:hypothetical protein
MLFLIISIFLGFIISYFYTQKLNISFLLLFIILSIVIYILFALLGKDKEKFDNYVPLSIDGSALTYKDKFGNVDPLYYLSKNNIMSEESHQNQTQIYNQNVKKNYNKIIHNIISEEHHGMNNEMNNGNKVLSEENNNYYHIISRDYNTGNNHIPPEEESHLAITPSVKAVFNNPEQLLKEHPEYKTICDNILKTPDINKIQLNNGLPSNLPLNINISYNSQNSVNEVGNNKVDESSDHNQKKMNPPHSDNINTNQINRNIGNIAYGTSRIYNNQDWIYGSQAWTNDPDYYIPTKNKIYNNVTQNVSQPLNELRNAKKFKDNDNVVCPLMINSPWSEYRTGDNQESDTVH